MKVLNKRTATLNKQAVVLDRLKQLYNQDLVCRKLQRWPLSPITNAALENLSPGVRSYKCLEIAKELCAMFPDNLFFAGGFILNCMGFDNKYESTLPDVDFFIVADSEQQAIEIILKCVEFLRSQETENSLSKIIRSAGALTYIRQNNQCESWSQPPRDPEEEIPEMGAIDCLLCHSDLKFQFIHRLYSHRSQIVGMFDIFPCGVLYSHKDGFLATPLASYCIEKKVIFMDPTRLSTSFQKRLEKYTERGFTIRIPNFNKDLIAQNRRYSPLIGYYEAVEYVQIWDYDSYYSTRESHWVHKERYETTDYQEEDKEVKDLIKTLYFHVPLSPNAPLLVDPKNMQVDLQTMMNIHRELGNDLFPPLVKNVNVGILKNAVNGDKRRKIVNTLFFDEDPQDKWNAIGENLALERQYALRDHFKPYSEGGFFKIANPGEQGGGSFNPTVKTGSEFWNPEKANPIHVGISNEVYWLLKQILLKNTRGNLLPREILQMICMWCVVSLSH